jgi:hypothetical protein
MPGRKDEWLRWFPTAPVFQTILEKILPKFVPLLRQRTNAALAGQAILSDPALERKRDLTTTGAMRR